MAQLSFPEQPSQRSRGPGRGLLLAGVAAAGLMGVGLGLWARPAMSERKLAMAPAQAPEPASTRTLQIVVDDSPAPLGAPIEVLPAVDAPRKVVLPERLLPEPLAPVRQAAGLVRVQTVEPEPQPVEAPPPAKIARKPAPKAVAKAVAPARVAKVAAPKAKAKPLGIEKVKVVEKAKVKPAKTRVAKAPTKDQVRLAKADRREKPARIEKAEAEVKKPSRLNGLVHAIARAVPHKAEPAPAPKPQKARLERKKAKAPKPRVEKVAAKPAKVAPPKAIRPARGAGPVRVAKAAPRPDSAIRDADRQMDRAYSSARAAGVPDWQLRKQQARWEAARASAAREAPWAVHDVYLARIAELHDLTRDAQGSGY
jgi:hypothetical protein